MTFEDWVAETYPDLAGGTARELMRSAWDAAQIAARQEMASRGGRTAAANMTPDARRARAKKAAEARWASS